MHPPSTHAARSPHTATSTELPTAVDVARRPNGVATAVRDSGTQFSARSATVGER
jgi:hypothetical protein